MNVGWATDDLVTSLRPPSDFGASGNGGLVDWHPSFRRAYDAGGAEAAWDAIRRRRSATSFAPATVSARLLRDVCAHALHQEELAWPGRPRLEIAVLRRDFAGEPTDRSVTIHSRQGCETLASIQRLDPRALSPDPDLHDAPALLVVLGDLERACEPDGVRGYWELLARAGFVAHTASLAVLSRGLSTRSFRAFHRAPLNRALGDEQAVSRRQLIAVAVGHPPS